MNNNYFKKRYCEALSLIPFAIDKDVEELNLCDETLCRDCIFGELSICDSVVRYEYFLEHFNEIFSKEVNKKRPCIGIDEEFWIGGCGTEIDCEECLFNNYIDCQKLTRNFIWDNIED